MKKFLLGVLITFTLIINVAAESYDNLCCRENYCEQDCDKSNGDYCGRYGCGQNS